MNYTKIVDEFITKDKLKYIFEKYKENTKTNNPFILAMKDKNLIKYSSMCRSIDSRIGNFIGKLAKEIVKNRFKSISKEEETEIRKQYKTAPDLCFLKNDIWTIIELKAGGNIDSKKMKSERDSLDKIKLFVSKKKNKPAKFFYATAYDAFGNKAGYEKLCFSEDEMLIGEDFWNFICDDSMSQNYILRTYQSIIKKYEVF